MSVVNPRNTFYFNVEISGGPESASGISSQIAGGTVQFRSVFATPRQVSVPATAWQRAGDAAAREPVTVGAPLRRANHHRASGGHDHFANLVHGYGLHPAGHSGGFHCVGLAFDPAVVRC